MIEGINVLDLVIILGAIQGILFVIFLWINPLKSKKASLFLSLFILGFALSSVYYTLETIGLRGFLTFWDFTPLYCPILIIASLYLFIGALLSPETKIDLLGKMLLGLSTIQLMWQLWGTYWSVADREVLLKHQQFIFSVYNGFDILLLVLSVVVLYVSIRRIKKYDKTLQHNYAEIGSFSLTWLNRLFFILFGILVLFAIPTLMELITGNAPFNVYYPMWIVSSMLIYWIGYSTYARNVQPSTDLYHHGTDESENKLSENTVAYHEQLSMLMKEERLFLDQELDLKSLADKLNLSSGYLSQIINKYEQKNFFDFINGYRVEEVKSKIPDPAYQHLSLLGIAFESGFKSKSTFNLAFKKHTGMTPSGFKKSLASPIAIKSHTKTS